MPTSPRIPAKLTGRVFRGSPAVQRGLITGDELRSTAWTRVRHDVYADARLIRDHELACRAALTRLPATTVLAGPSAAFLHGVGHAASYDDEVHVITPPAIRVGTQQRLRVHHTTLRDDEVTGRVTRPARTAWDLAAWLDPLEAVPIVDTMLNCGLTTADEFSRQIDRRAGQRGWRRAKRVCDLADSGAASPAESRLRVRLIMAGLPRPVTQCPVPISPGLILHPDLGWPDWQVAVEYDGYWHAHPDQIGRDRRRLNHLVAAGWAVLHVTNQQMRGDFPRLVSDLRSTLRARGWQPRRRP